MQTSQVIVYTSSAYDQGSHSGTWGAILKFDKQDKKLSGRVTEVSAGRLELLTVINVLRKLVLPHFW
jgi:ribonuclease HI